MCRMAAKVELGEVARLGRQDQARARLRARHTFEEVIGWRRGERTRG